MHEVWVIEQEDGGIPVDVACERDGLREVGPYERIESYMPKRVFARTLVAYENATTKISDAITDLMLWRASGTDREWRVTMGSIVAMYTNEAAQPVARIPGLNDIDALIKAAAWAKENP